MNPRTEPAATGSGADRSGLDTSHPILLFDGECNLCNGVVQLLLRLDRRGRLRFGSLQSERAHALLRSRGLPTDALESVILIDRGRTYFKSRAALETFRALGGPWRLLYALVLIPRPLRDAVYGLISKYRYRLFGKRRDCMVPTPELRDRFLP